MNFIMETPQTVELMNFKFVFPSKKHHDVQIKLPFVKVEKFDCYNLIYTGVGGEGESARGNFGR